MSKRALLAFALLATACRTDPVPQAKIDALPAETGATGADHRPGQSCLLCHDTYGGATPFAVAGTVFTRDGDGPIAAAPHVLVLVTDSTGDTRKACTSSSGNFFVAADKWAGVKYPLTVRAGDRTMRSLIGRNGSCAGCHELPSKDSLDPVTGASRSSPGVVLVGPGSADPACGGGP